MKKVYVENSQSRKVLLAAEAGTLVGDEIYFFSSAYNLLYKVDIPDFTVSIISHIPCEKIIAYEWFRKARYWNGKLLFIPSYAEKIWIYDLNNGEWNSITIDYPKKSLKFWGAIIHQNTAFLFGVSYPAVLKVNLVDYSISYLEIKCPTKQKMMETGLFFTDAVKIGHNIFCPVSISNQILQLNLETLEYKWIQIGDISNQYSGIDYGGDYIWISPGESGKIVKWNGELEWEEFDVPKEISKRSYQFIGVICEGDKTNFLTQQDGESLKIDKENRILLTKATKRYIHLERYENGTIVLMQSNAHIDVKWKGKWIQGVCEIPYEDFKMYFNEASMWNVAAINENLQEAEVFKVNDYIEISTKHSEQLNVISNNCMGINIWKAVKKLE